MRIKNDIFKTNAILKSTMEYLFMLAGCFILAASFNTLLLPNHIASGGVTGVSVIMKELFGIEPAITQWLLNIPLFFIGLAFLGGKFSIKTIVATFTFPLFILITNGFPPVTDNLILASVFGGLGVGLALGIVFRCNGSTGGFSIIAQIVHKYTGISIGTAIMAIDFTVILASALVFNVESALFALVALFVTGKAIDIVQLGFTSSKVAFVISEKHEAISNAILDTLDRGLTKLTGFGGYTGNSQTVLMVVMGSTEVLKFKALVKAEDPHAFIIISETHEVLGKGFKMGYSAEMNSMKGLKK